MVDREMFPIMRLDIAKRGEQFQWIGIKVHAWGCVGILQRVDVLGAPSLAADDPASFVGRVAAGKRDKLV
jgi:hypothetical protein